MSNARTYVDEIRDLNLNYLVFAQQMIREDLPTAVGRLGLCESVASMLRDLSTAQLISLASSPSMLTRFRFEDADVLGILAQEQTSRLGRVHTAILMASQPVAEIH